MGISDYFRPADTMTPAELRNFLNSRDSGDYNLVDVRQPGEYERKHIPGAQLIPVAELSERTTELDPEKPTITY